MKSALTIITTTFYTTLLINRGAGKPWSRLPIGAITSMTAMWNYFNPMSGWRASKSAPHRYGIIFNDGTLHGLFVRDNSGFDLNA